MSFIAVIGASGCGKTTVINGLIRLFPTQYRRAKSFTTRKRRADENSDEYTFITSAELHRKLNAGAILYIDEAFGNEYAIDSSEFEARNINIIKEIHPKNLANLNKVVDHLIIIKVVGQQRIDRAGRKDDFDYDSFPANIVLRNDDLEDFDTQVINLHRKIQSLILHKDLCIPCGDIIDTANKKGYDGIANEFTDERRITTANFHDASKSFFLNKFNKIDKTKRLIEIGSGNGWLSSMLEYEMPSIDISDEMNAGKNQKHVGIRQLKERSNSYDYVFASLCDPFFYPEAIAEIIRISSIGGEIYISLPSKKWSDIARNGETKNTFVNSLGQKFELFSFNYTREQLEYIGEKLGFIVEESFELSLLNYQKEISADISESAKNVDIAIKDFVIVDCYTLKKTGIYDYTN